MSRDPSTHDEDPRDAFRAILAEVSELLTWEKALGTAGVPASLRSQGAAETATGRPAPGATPRGAVPGTVSSPGTVRASSPGSVRAAAPFPSVKVPVASDDRVQRLAVLADEAAACTRCVLHKERTKSVFARGNPASPLVFVGEGPGYNEDQQGLPFVGNAGQLLDRMIKAMGFAPEDVYICNVVKCRPPENRTPLPDEAKACESYLIGQLDVVAPKMIVALGRCAAENLGAMEPGGKGWRGKFTEWRGVPVMSTYHPAYLLRNEAMKRPVWEDLQLVMKRLQGMDSEPSA